MDNNKRLKFSCTHCGNCCKDSKTIVNITHFDILRIQKGLRLTLEELIEIVGFYIYNQEISEDNREKMVLSPIITQKGLAFVGLLKKDDGSCYFYDNSKKRCLIYNLRPLICRTFPFHFEFSSTGLKEKEEDLKINYTQKAIEYCAGIGNDAPPIIIEEWLEKGNKTLNLFKKNDNINEGWNKNVNKGKIIPSIRLFLQSVLNLDNDLEFDYP